MIRQSHMNQSRLSPMNNCCLFTRWQAAPKPSDTCTSHPAVWHMWTSHTRTHTHTQKHLTLPCHTLISINTFFKVTIHNVFCPHLHPTLLLLLWHLRLPLCLERIHNDRRACQLRNNPSILISQKGIMRVITYIVIQVNSLARTWLNALPGDKQ